MEKQERYKCRKTQRMEEVAKADQGCQPEIYIRRKADLAEQRKLKAKSCRKENQYICITATREIPKLEAPSSTEGRGEVWDCREKG